MVQSPRSALKLLTLPRQNSDPQHHMQLRPGAQMQLEFRKKLTWRVTGQLGQFLPGKGNGKTQIRGQLYECISFMSLK